MPPQRKSVRFEDIDDEPDGGFGLKVGQWVTRVKARGRLINWLIGRLTDLVDRCGTVKKGSMHACPCSRPRLWSQWPHPTALQHVQGLLTNAYATLTSYGKWARTHSKTVSVSACHGMITLHLSHLPTDRP